MRRLLTWYDAHRSGRTVLLGWLATRMLMCVIFSSRRERFMTGDVTYYHHNIANLFVVGLPHTLTEYPTPVVWILWLPYGLTGGNRTAYVIVFAIIMMALDAAFTVALWRSAGRRNHSTDFWIGFVFLVGPLCYLRFDLLPAVLAGGALLAARRRPWVTGALTGLGAAVKLWPALLYPAFLAFRGSGKRRSGPRRRALTLGFVAVGFGLALLSLIFGGWSRLVSPLTWQSDRGLQVESVWATPLILARALHRAGWSVSITDFHAYEISGPGVGVMLLASNVATVLGLLTIGALLLRAFRNPAPRLVGLGVAILGTVAIMIITNKTLSPQYLLWLGGVMAAVLLIGDQATESEHRLLRRLALQLLVLALLTHLVFPLLYSGVLGLGSTPIVVLGGVIMALRNLALLAFTVEVCRLAWAFLAPARTVAAPELAPR